MARAKEKLTKIVRKGRRPQSGDFERLWGARDAREAISRMQHNKCCYCERPRDVTRESDIEHFRPKSSVTDCADAGYWWLAYTWTNLFFSCQYCNQEHKGNQFPLLDEEARARKPRDSLKREKPILIDPSREDPELFIGWDFAGASGQLVRPFARGSSRRGLKTIEILGLDQSALNMERAEDVITYQGIAALMEAGRHFGSHFLISEAETKIRTVTSARRRFAGVAREYFRSRGLGAYISTD